MYEGMAADEQPDKINEGKAPMQVLYSMSFMHTIALFLVSREVSTIQLIFAKYNIALVAVRGDAVRCATCYMLRALDRDMCRETTPIGSKFARRYLHAAGKAGRFAVISCLSYVRLILFFMSEPRGPSAESSCVFLSLLFDFWRVLTLFFCFLIRWRWTELLI